MLPQPSLMAALILGALSAQEVPEPVAPIPSESVAPAAQDHSEGWVWRRTLQTQNAFVDLAQDPQDPKLLLAVDLRGAAWQSVDGGQSWRQTLDSAGPLIESLDDEALLLEAEATAQDFFEDEVVDGEENDDQERFAVDANDVDLLVQRGQGAVGDPQMRIGGSLWFHPERGGVVLLSRSDGLWRSMDSGARWRKLSEASTLTSMLLAPDGSILAGSSDGVKLSRDAGANWRDASGMGGVRVRDVAQSGGAFFAATDQGLFFSMDGMAWAPAGKMGQVEADLRALQADPSMTGGLWIATDSEVLRSDDGGQSVFALSGTPLPGTSNLSQGPSGRNLIAATRDGIWESLDGGVRWQPVSYGLPEPITSDVLVVEEYLVAATPEGLWRMEPEEEVQAVFRTGNTPGLSLDDTLYLTLNRPGMRANTLRPIASLAPRLVPDLIIQGRAQQDFRRGSEYEATLTTGDSTLRWFVGAQLTWNGSNPSYSSVDGATDVYSGDTYYVLDGEVMSTQDATALPVAAANAQSKSVRYQRNVAGQVTDLYLSRSTMLAEQNSIPGDDLRAQTLHELKIQETTALLDAYTDGKFSTSASAASDGETP